MKKLMTLALAAAMMLGATTGANAIDFKDDDTIDKLLMSDISIDDPVKVYLKDIGKNAFQNCKNLQQVVLPVTLKYIREGAFAGCKELVEIKFNDVPSRWVRVIKELGWIDDLSAVTVILRDEF